MFKYISIVVCLALWLLIPNLTDAATYYVGGSGASNSNPCVNGNINAPKQTVAAGVGCLGGAGDILYIRQGTYGETIDDTQVTIPSGSSWSNPVTIASAPGETATLQGVSIRNQVISYVVFDRLTLDVGGSPNTTNAGNGALQFAFQSHLRFSNGEIRNANFHLISAGQGADIQIINNQIHGAYVYYDYGFLETVGAYCAYFNAHDSLIEGNTIYDCAQYGLHLYYGPCSSCISNNIIRNNTFYNNSYDDGDRGTSGASILMSRGQDNLIYNNIIYNGQDIHHLAGIQDQNANDQIYNNTFYNMAKLGIYLYPGSSGIVARNNIIYSTGQAPILNDGGAATFSNNLCGTSATGCTNIGNPLFINQNGGDFHLQSGSPAIAIGANLSGIFTTDIAGAARAPSGAWDVGAYVFGAIPNVATQVEFSMQPQNRVANSPLNNLNIQVQNASGALVTSATDTVTLAIVSTQVAQGSLSVVSVDSFNTGYEKEKAIDGDPSTFWFTRFTPDDPPHPHNIVVTFPSGSVNGMTYLSRPDTGVNGYISGYNVYVSTDGVNWGTAVKTGTFGTQQGKRYGITWTPKTGAYLKFESTSSTPENIYAGVAELTVLMSSSVTLAGTKVVQASGGNAFFPGLIVGTAGVRYIIQATAPGLASQLSLPFDITNPPPPPGLVPPSLLRYIPGR